MRILMNYFLIKGGIYGGEKDGKLLKNNGEMGVKKINEQVLTIMMKNLH